MVDLSFAVSGLNYFWGIGRSKLGYRKMVGVTGFFVSLVHASIASNLFAGSFLLIVYIINNPIAGIPALLAILIMTMMVIVSNGKLPQRLGALLWRRLLRVGYVAIGFIIIHATLLSYSEWIPWFKTFKPILPPLSLLAFLFSVFTILLRIALFVALDRKKRIVQKPITGI
jgi:DMSO/TMAO reductase YedYZ heme-binding membrane subunit